MTTYSPYCSEPGCDKPVEGRTGMCASHNRIRRKVDNVKLPEDPTPIKKVSESTSAIMKKYALLKKKLLYNQWCAVHGKPCIPTDLHHRAGRSSEAFLDEEAREKGMPLLIDHRNIIVVCRAAHKEIEENPVWAKSHNYSEDRLTKKETI